MSHVKFVHWTARMPNSDKLCNNFRAAGTNGRLYFSLSLLAACGSVSCPYRMWSGSKELRLAKESVAPWRRSSAGWMSEKTGRLSVGVGRRHPVTMRKKMPLMTLQTPASYKLTAENIKKYCYALLNVVCV